MPDLPAVGFVVHQWRIIALVQMLRGLGLTVTPDELARRMGMHRDSARYHRMLAGLRAAGYLGKSGCSLTKRGQAAAAWPQNLVSRYSTLQEQAQPRVRAKHQRQTYTRAQQRILEGLRQELEYFEPFHGRHVDLRTESVKDGPFRLGIRRHSFVRC